MRLFKATLRQAAILVLMLGDIMCTENDLKCDVQMKPCQETNMFVAEEKLELSKTFIGPTPSSNIYTCYQMRDFKYHIKKVGGLFFMAILTPFP